MIDLLVKSGVVSVVQAVKLAMFVDWPNIVLPESISMIGPVVTVIAGNCALSVTIPCEDLSIDLSIVGPIGRTMAVQNYATLNGR